MSTGNSVVNIVFGANFNDFIRGKSGTDIIFGFGGDDILDGGCGRDVIDGGEGDDVVLAGGGNDVAFGGDGRDRMFGEGGRDRMFGGQDEDEIDGGGGDDFIQGGEGGDRLTGGRGKDVFAYANEDGGDVIVDFETQDSFLLDAATFGVVGGPTVIRAERVSDDPNEAFAETAGGGNVYLLGGGFANAGQAASVLATALQTGDGIDEGAGFFVYFNVNLGVARLFHSADLDTAGAPLQQLANLGDPGTGSPADIAALSAANFAFGETLIV